MLTKLAVAPVLWCCVAAISSGDTENYAVEVLYSAPNRDAVLAWGKQQRGYCRVLEYNRGNNSVIVLLLDRGSGVRLDEIYLYGISKSQKKWHLVFFRPTDTEVEVQEEDGKLVFRTITGDVILEQSLDAIGPFGEVVRKRVEDSKKTK